MNQDDKRGVNPFLDPVGGQLFSGRGNERKVMFEKLKKAFSGASIPGWTLLIWRIGGHISTAQTFADMYHWFSPFFDWLKHSDYALWLAVLWLTLVILWPEHKRPLVKKPGSAFADDPISPVATAGGETFREFSRPVFTVQNVKAELTSHTAITYKSKVRITLTNQCGTAIGVWKPTWDSKEVQIQQPFGCSLQLEDAAAGGWMADRWLEEKECLTVAVGQSFRCWIGLTHPIGEGLQRRIDVKTTGRAVFPVRISDKLYEAPVSL